ARLAGRSAPDASDLWVLRDVWDREEQIEPLAALVNGMLEQHGAGPAAHALARVEAAPDGEEIARQLDGVEQQLKGGRLTLSAVARLKERVTDLADRAAWLGDAESRGYLLERTRKCLEELG